MKMYTKSDLKLVNGMLVSPDGNIIVPDRRIVRQANDLETLSQKVAYLAKQPSATPMPSLDGFKRKSINDDVINGARFEASTPLLDMQAAKTMALMDELDDVKTVEKANKMLANFTELLAFVNDEHVIDCGGESVIAFDTIAFDTPTLGSVLELTQKDITAVVAMASGLHGDDDCANYDDDCALNPTLVARDDSDSVRKRITMDQLTPEEAAMLISIIENHDAEATEIDADEEDSDTEAEQD